VYPSSSSPLVSVDTFQITIYFQSKLSSKVCRKIKLIKVCAIHKAIVKNKPKQFNQEINLLQGSDVVHNKII
jgi:hypothetical protein